MKELGMAIGTAAGSIFGSLMGNKMQQDQFGNQLTLMKKQHEYNEASANAAQARAYEMWKETNYPAQIEQMKKANLSPALMYGQAGAGGGIKAQPKRNIYNINIRRQMVQKYRKKIQYKRRKQRGYTSYAAMAREGKKNYKKINKALVYYRTWWKLNRKDTYSRNLMGGRFRIINTGNMEIWIYIYRSIRD